MKYFKLKLIRWSGLLAFIFSFLFSGKNSLADTAPAPTDSTFPGVDLTIQSVFGIITGLVCWFTRLALIFIVVMVVYYGIQFMMARGDSAKFADAKKAFTYGLLGILVILGTYTIIATIANGLGADYSLIIPLDCTAY